MGITIVCPKGEFKNVRGLQLYVQKGEFKNVKWVINDHNNLHLELHQDKMGGETMMIMMSPLNLEPSYCIIIILINNK